MDGGAWWAAVHGVAKSRTLLSNFAFTFHFHVLEKAMATLSSVLAWRIPGTAEPGGLLSMGSHRVRQDWRDLAAAAAVAQIKRRWTIEHKTKQVPMVVGLYKPDAEDLSKRWNMSTLEYVQIQDLPPMPAHGRYQKSITAHFPTDCRYILIISLSLELMSHPNWL